MRRRTFAYLALTAALAFGASPAMAAGATNWTQLRKGVYVDTYSVVHKGTLATYRTYYGAAAPATEEDNAVARHEGIDCSTRRWYETRNGQLVPSGDGEGDEFDYAASDDWIYLQFCK